MSIFLTAFAVSASSPATALGAVPLSLASIAAVFSASPVAVSLNLSMTSLSLAARTVAVAFLATDSGVPGASAPVSLSLSATTAAASFLSAPRAASRRSLTMEIGFWPSASCSWENGGGGERHRASTPRCCASRRTPSFTPILPTLTVAPLEVAALSAADTLESFQNGSKASPAHVGVAAASRATARAAPRTRMVPGWLKRGGACRTGRADARAFECHAARVRI